MEGQYRAYNAYDLSYFQRYFLGNICCLEKFFRKKMLLQKGNLFVQDTVDPEIILWENKGVPFGRRFKYGCWTACFMVC